MSGFYCEASWLEIVNQKIYYASPCFKIVSHINLALFPQIAILRDPGTRDWRKKARENRDQREFTSSPGLVSAYLSRFCSWFLRPVPKTCPWVSEDRKYPSALYVKERLGHQPQLQRSQNKRMTTRLIKLQVIPSHFCTHLTATDCT